MTGAIFLDRDGTINVPAAPHEYVTWPHQFHFLPGVLDALAFLAKNSGRKIVILTNQACLGKGLATRAQVNALHEWVRTCIEYAGGRVDGVYVCPHRPEDTCLCRKPQPGLLHIAANDLDINLTESCLIGDGAADLYAGWSAGLEECYLVLTGHELETYPIGHPYEVYTDLDAAAHAIVRKEQERAQHEGL